MLGMSGSELCFKESSPLANAGLTLSEVGRGRGQPGQGGPPEQSWEQNHPLLVHQILTSYLLHTKPHSRHRGPNSEHHTGPAIVGLADSPTTNKHTACQGKLSAMEEDTKG